MMMAASTSSPTAMASPPSVIVFKPTPSGLRSRPARATDRGMVRVTINAARTFPNKNRITSTTKTPPSSTARPTPPRADVTRSDWS